MGICVIWTHFLLFVICPHLTHSLWLRVNKELNNFKLILTQKLRYEFKLNTSGSLCSRIKDDYAFMAINTKKKQ